MRRPAVSPVDARVAVSRFPTLFRACQQVAIADGRRERCTSELFAAAAARYPVDAMRVVENRLAAMTPAEREAVVRQLGL